MARPDMMEISVLESLTPQPPSWQPLFWKMQSTWQLAYPCKDWMFKVESLIRQLVKGHKIPSVETLSSRTMAYGHVSPGKRGGGGGGGRGA